MKEDLYSLLLVALATRSENRCKTCAFLRKEGKVLQIEAVAGFEPSVNVIGIVYSVAVTRQLIHSGGYLAD
jgi:hypothetical protein